MAPSNKEIESAVRAFIKGMVDNDEEDIITVRYVRNGVEEKLNLDEGFFVTEEVSFIISAKHLSLKLR
jgi:hypothetical protein